MSHHHRQLLLTDGNNGSSSRGSEVSNRTTRASSGRPRPHRTFDPRDGDMIVCEECSFVDDMSGPDFPLNYTAGGFPSRSIPSSVRGVLTDAGISAYTEPDAWPIFDDQSFWDLFNHADSIEAFRTTSQNRRGPYHFVDSPTGEKMKVQTYFTLTPPPRGRARASFQHCVTPQDFRRIVSGDGIEPLLNDRALHMHQIPGTDCYVERFELCHDPGVSRHSRRYRPNRSDDPVDHHTLSVVFVAVPDNSDAQSRDSSNSSRPLALMGP